MNLAVKVCLVNRNYPPDKGATGFHAQRLVGYLVKNRGYNIHVVSVGDEKDTASRSYIRGIYNGKVKLWRLFSSLVESYFLIKKARSIPSDVYIIMTDPPFLNYWAARLLNKKRWVIWTMDLYPEAFAANKLVSRYNMAYKYYQKALKKSPPFFMITLGPMQERYLKNNYYSMVPSIHMPVGLVNENGDRSDRDDEIPYWADRHKIIFGYIGSIGEAHDQEALVQFIEYLDDSKHKIVISCSGSKAQDLIKQTNELNYVEVIDYIPQDQMSYIDIQIVTLLSEWTHICVPSKALTALEVGNAILFFGAEKSDTWQYVHAVGWRISEDFKSDTFLEKLDRHSLSERKRNALKISKLLHEQLLLSYASLANELIKHK